MEEENECTSLADMAESVLQLPQQESWTSVDHQCINGEQDAAVWGDTEVHINQTNEVDEVSLSSKGGQQTPEEAEQWEQMIWPMHSITCTSPPFSFATVQWDVPDASAETPLLMTNSSLTNELCCGGVMTPESFSPSLCQPQDVTADLVEQDDIEEEDDFDSQLLNSENQWTGNYSEPCDAADVNEPKTQEEEDSAHELLDSNNEVTQRTDTEEFEEHSVKPSENLINTAEVVEDDVDAYVDVKLEEEQEEVCDLLSVQEDTEGIQTSVNEVKTEDENKDLSEDDEECFVTNVSSDEESEKANTDSFLTDVEISEEPLQTDTELNTPTIELIDLQEPKLLEDSRKSGGEEELGILERLREDLAGQSEEVDMCEDVDQNVEPGQLETVDNDEETLMEEAENAARTEDLQEDLHENLEDRDSLEQQECGQGASPDRMASLVPEHSEDLEMTDKPEQIMAEVSYETKESDQLGQSQEKEVAEEMAQPENAEQSEVQTVQTVQTEKTDCVETDDSRVTDPPQQTEASDQDEQTLQTADTCQPTLSEQPVPTEISDESEMADQLSPGTELIQQQTQEAALQQVEKQAEMCDQAEDAEVTDKGDVQKVIPNGKEHKALDTAVPYMNGEVDRTMACCLAEQLFKLDGIPRAEVVKHLDKNNDFSHAVGEEYLKFFDFTGQTLDQALRSFLKVVILIGETQERERVLQHFSCRFHQCNPDSFIASGAVLALTCALMLLNTDLHGQNVGKSMSSSKFVSNLDGMNEGGNFSKDLLKSLYNSIKSEPLEWAVDEEELKNSVLVDEDVFDDAPLRSKANPFLDVPHDKKASVAKQGFLQRKLLADIDGKRTPWGKRGWKTFYGVLKGMVLYLQKDDYRRDNHANEEVVSVHHSVAEQAADYTKKPHVFRLQTADWRVFLFQASSKVEMYSWISRINLISALHSSPPFPAAVGSQRRFCRPILPASQSAHTLERQLQSYAGMLESFKADLLYQQQNPPEGKKAKARDLEEHRVRTEYLHHEMCRYEIYIQMLEAWKNVKKTEDSLLCTTDLNVFDKAVCADSVGEEAEEEGGLKKSHSSPSLELELAPPTVIKVKRNISERRTYRRTIVPRMNKET